MWEIAAAWGVCMASCSLPWPATTLVVLLCCVACFELASPMWIGRWRRTPVQPTKKAESQHDNDGPRQQDAPTAASSVAPAVARRWSPPAALAAALQSLVRRLRAGDPCGQRGGLEEVGVTAAAGGGGGGGREDSVASPADSKQKSSRNPEKSSATFLKGSVGSFSRGGLMVTHEGRVIYKVNQDRGLISHPNLNNARHTVLGVFDGHGENGEHVAAYTMREVPRRLGLHPDSLRDPVKALQDVFLDINSSLPKSGINAVFGGCTAVVALLRGPLVWVANAGDSRALVAGRGGDGLVVARGLTRDQNPDSPGERERIEALGGFVSDPDEPGASARVWLDETRTLVGLAMARSIGDLAVKRVGVIALPEVTEYTLKPEDEFMVLASDGIWEFIDNQEAAEVIQGFFDKGEDAAGACKGLMELANRRWSDMVGDYRDDITCSVIRLPFLPPAAEAEALAVHDRLTKDGAGGTAAGTARTAREADGGAAEKSALATEKAGETAEHAGAAAAAAAAAATTTGSSAEPPAGLLGAAEGSSTDSSTESAKAESLEPAPKPATPSKAALRVEANPDGGAQQGKEDAWMSKQQQSSASAAVNDIFSGGGGEESGSDDGHKLLIEGGKFPTRGEEEENEEARRVKAVELAIAEEAAATGLEDPATDEESESETLASTPMVTPEDVSEVDGEEAAEGEDGDEDTEAEEEDGQDQQGLDQEGVEHAKTGTVFPATPKNTLAAGRGSKGLGGGEKGEVRDAAATTAAMAAAAAAAKTAAQPAQAPASLPAMSPVGTAVLVAPAMVGAITPSRRGTGAVVVVEVEGGEEEEGEGEQQQQEGQEDGEEWEWEYGARENREPSREIREASREFPSGSLDALVAGVAGPSPLKT